MKKFLLGLLLSAPVLAYCAGTTNVVVLIFRRKMLRTLGAV